MAALTGVHGNIISSTALVVGEGWEELVPTAVGGVRREQVPAPTTPVVDLPHIRHPVTAHLQTHVHTHTHTHAQYILNTFVINIADQRCVVRSY